MGLSDAKILLIIARNFVAAARTAIVGFSQSGRCPMFNGIYLVFK
jgi:hypothetical protein